MKKFILAATAIVSAASLTPVAQAADIAPAAYDWSGFYFGLNAGAAWNNSDIENDLEYTGPAIDQPAPIPDITPDQVNDFLDAFGGDLDGDETAFTGGALIGFNWQHDSLVLGVEADINYVGFGEDWSRDFNDIDVPISSSDDINVNSDLSFDANWFGTLRARLGFAADNFLIYGTGGLAYGHLEAEATITGGTEDEFGTYSASADATNWGWTAGAGVEYGINNWSLGVEYLYVDLGSADWDADVTENVDDPAISAFLANVEGAGEVDYQFSVIRATAKIRF